MVDPRTAVRVALRVLEQREEELYRAQWAHSEAKKELEKANRLLEKSKQEKS